MKTENAPGKNKINKKKKKKYIVKSQETKNKAHNSFDCLGKLEEN